jgi:hypothetical protein
MALARTIRWTLYVLIFLVTSAASLSRGLWPPGGPDTEQARDVAMLLSAVLGLVGVCAVVIYLTAPKFQ